MTNSAFTQNPNVITTSTGTALNGYLKGDGTSVSAQATPIPKADLPTAVAYEDEANVFTLQQSAIITDTTNAGYSDAPVVITHNLTSGTASNGMGVPLQFDLQDASGTKNQPAGQLVCYWHNSLASKLQGGLQLVPFSGGSGGIAAVDCYSGTFGLAVGFLGNSPVIQQAGDIGTALTNFGLMVGTPTFSAANLTSINSVIPAGTLWDYGGVTLPSGWLKCDGSAISRTTFATLFAALSKTATVTITIASPGVITWNAHGFSDGDPVFFSTTGALPTGITSGTTYFVKSSTTNTFNIAATVGGTAINTTGTQSGTHTGNYVPWGKGDGSTTFNVPDLRGRTSIGSGTGSGLTARNLAATGGEETHQLTIGELAAHTHNTPAGDWLLTVTGTENFALPFGAGANVAVNQFNATSSVGSNTAHNNMQPFGVVTKMIKT